MLIESAFSPSIWQRNTHLQTLWPTLLRRPPRIDLRRERLELPDGDFIDLDWTPRYIVVDKDQKIKLFEAVNANDKRLKQVLL